MQQQITKDEEDVDKPSSTANDVALLCASQGISEERSAQQIGEKLENNASKHPHGFEEVKVWPIGSNGEEQYKAVKCKHGDGEAIVEG